MKILQNIILKGPKTISLSQGAHMSVADPDSEELLAVYFKPGNSSVINSVKPRVNLNNI
jgi:hypothetical protein